MNNPAYEESQNNAALESHYARECLASATDEVYYGRDIQEAAVDWDVSVAEINLSLADYYGGESS